jgi:hypothetical protein
MKQQEDAILIWLRITFPHGCINCKAFHHCHSDTSREEAFQALVNRKKYHFDSDLLRWGSKCNLWR